jgi:cytochrome c1
VQIVRALLPLMLTAGCEASPGKSQHMAQADAVRGKLAIERAGCGACHDIPGIRWPKGQAGPSLQGFGDQGMIAGRLPNRPDLLAAYVRNAPATLPGTTMPRMPLTPAEARDIAAYLYAASARR